MATKVVSLKMTPAKAKKLRSAAMKACGCCFCAFALAGVPKTFVEHDALMAMTLSFNETLAATGKSALGHMEVVGRVSYNGRIFDAAGREVR